MNYADAAVCYLDVIRAECAANTVIRAMPGSPDLWARMQERGWLRWRAQDLVEAHPPLRELDTPDWFITSNDSQGGTQ